MVQFQGSRPATPGGGVVGRRAETCSPRQAAQGGQQRTASRRTDERSRRRYVTVPRGGPDVIRRVRRCEQTRSVVLGSDCYTHARIRGREPGRLVRRKL